MKKSFYNGVNGKVVVVRNMKVIFFGFWVGFGLIWDVCFRRFMLLLLFFGSGGGSGGVGRVNWLVGVGVLNVIFFGFWVGFGLI